MIKGVEAVLREEEIEERLSDGTAEAFTCVMKFGGSSVASAERMREITDLILGFPEERPAVVLSAMGKSTNKLLLVFLTHTQNILFYFVILRGIIMELNACDEGWREGCQLWRL